MEKEEDGIEGRKKGMGEVLERRKERRRSRGMGWKGRGG